MRAGLTATARASIASSRIFHRDAEQTLSSEEIDRLQPVLAAYIPPKRKAAAQAGKAARLRADVDHAGPRSAAPADREGPQLRQWPRQLRRRAVHPLPPLRRRRRRGRARTSPRSLRASRCTTSWSRSSTPRRSSPSNTRTRSSRSKTATSRSGGSSARRRIASRCARACSRLICNQVKKAEIKSQQPSKISPMPPGLLSMLSKDDVLDLLAYLASGGKQDAPAFGK